MKDCYFSQRCSIKSLGTLTSIPLTLRWKWFFEANPKSLKTRDFPPEWVSKWGRHGFDGDACGQKACRGALTRNRGQNDNCQSTDGIRCLIVGSRPRRLGPRASEGRRTAGCSSQLRLG